MADIMAQVRGGGGGGRRKGKGGEREGEVKGGREEKFMSSK